MKISISFLLFQHPFRIFTPHPLSTFSVLIINWFSLPCTSYREHRAGDDVWSSFIVRRRATIIILGTAAAVNVYYPKVARWKFGYSPDAQIHEQLDSIRQNDMALSQGWRLRFCHLQHLLMVTLFQNRGFFLGH